MWQALHFQEFMQNCVSGLEVELVPVLTSGDRFLSQSLEDVSRSEDVVDKGFFTKEIEELLLRGEADVAIHSLKDLPTQLPPGLELSGVSSRGQVADIIVSSRPITGRGQVLGIPIPKLQGVRRVGTSSLRRSAQLRELFGKQEILLLRGNLNTRLHKLARGEYDLILLAQTGLERLTGQTFFPDNLDIAVWQADEAHFASEFVWEGQTFYLYRLHPELFVPACSQGFLGIESREGDQEVRELVHHFSDIPSFQLATAERAFLRTLEAGCHAPVAGYSFFTSPTQIRLLGKVLSRDGSRVLRQEKSADISDVSDAAFLGAALAEELLDAGAAAFMSYGS